MYIYIHFLYEIDDQYEEIDWIMYTYGLAVASLSPATITRLPKNIGLFCKRAIWKDYIPQKRPIFSEFAICFMYTYG